jgi:hypothetical protein
MAQRRMVSLDVIDTDAFLEMPVSCQLLYFHLNSRADDDGFVASHKKIARSVGSQSDDLKVLIGKKFVIQFNDGVLVIKHWRVNNFVRKDIYKETQYLNLKQTLFIRPNGAYTLTEDERSIPVPLGHFKLEDVDATLTLRQLSIGKGSEGKEAAPPTSSDGNYEIVADADPDRPAKKPRVAKIPVHEWVEVWNRYPNWKATGKKNIPANPSVIKGLLTPATQTQDITAAIIKKRTKYTLEDFERATKAYASEICNRTKDTNGFYLQRFTLYEFLTHKDVFQRYANR